MTEAFQAARDDTLEAVAQMLVSKGDPLNPMGGQYNEFECARMIRKMKSKRKTR